MLVDVIHYSFRFELHIFDNLVENQHTHQQMHQPDMEHIDSFDNIVSQNNVIANPIVTSGGRRVSDGSTDTSSSEQAYDTPTLSCRNTENTPPSADGVSAGVNESLECQAQQITFD